MLLGSEDAKTPVWECAPLRTRSEANGGRWIIYTRTSHGFDNPSFKGGLTIPGGASREPRVAVMYSPVIAAMANDEVAAFLDREPPASSE